MRDHTTPLYQELTSTGGDSVALTPGAAQQTGSFSISGLDPVTDGKRNYIQGIWCHVSSVFDPDAGGNAISADKLGKIMASWRLFSPLLGEVFPHRSTRGAVLQHLIQVLALGYQYPQAARAQIPASTDTDVTIDQYYFLPMSYEFLQKPQETSQWVGLFDQGVLEGSLDISTILDGDYAGGVLKATTALKAVVEFIPDPDDYVGVPVQWRDREIAGGGSQPTLMSVGQETQLQGVRSGCGLAFLAWLSNATGIGLGGPCGVDNLTMIELPWRNQKSLRNLDPYFLGIRRAAARRVGPIAGQGTTIMHDGGGWPFTMSDTPNNRPAASSQAMFLAPVYPGRDLQTSKLQRVNGNLKINLSATTPITAAHRFLTMEMMEFTEQHRDTLFAAMGIRPSSHVFTRKASLDNAPPEEKLRYTRWLAYRK